MSNIVTNIALSCKNVFKTYSEFKTDIEILKNINIDIIKGEKVAILGLSGSGKTTLLNILGGLDRCSSGEVHLAGQRFDNQSVNKRAMMRNQHLGFIYQLHHLLPEFTAIENVMIPLAITKKYSKAESIKKAKEILVRVGLDERFDHKPSELSGGERQRVASSCTSHKPVAYLQMNQLVILIWNAQRVYLSLCELSQTTKTSFVIVTHDEALKLKKMDKIYRLVKGNLVQEV